jgi:hypothetical protein
MNMQKNFSFLWIIIPVFFVFSCASAPAPRISPDAVSPEAPGKDVAGDEEFPETPAESPGLAVLPEHPAEPPQTASVSPEVPENPLLDAMALPSGAIAALPPETRYPEDAGRLPIRPYPPIPERILGMGRIPFFGLALFLLSVNPSVDPNFIEDLALYYIEEAAQEGVNHDVAFAQMCLETGFLNFGGLVTLDMNNFCGLGSIGPGQPGEQFSSPRIGARAHIQHLKAYATEIPLQQDLVDPRYRYVRYGSAPTLEGLTGSWAVDREYSRKIRNILERLYSFAFAPVENDALAKTDDGARH